MNTILREYLNDEQSNSSSETTKTNKLYKQVNEIMKVLILIPDYKRLEDFQETAIKFLQPGNSKRLAIKRLVSNFYFNYMDDEQNFQHFSNRDCAIQ